MTVLNEILEATNIEVLEEKPLNMAGFSDTQFCYDLSSQSIELKSGDCSCSDGSCFDGSCSDGSCTCK